MACTSGSVQSVADKTVAAKQQIDKLQQMIEDQNNDQKDKFYAEIENHLKDAKIADARELSYNSDIKTEYTSEFSLDKIAAVVTAALKAAAKAADPTVPNPAMSPDAINAYADVVNTVAEAAKSSSTASASLSFSMNRLSPGFFAFLSAYSVNISDEDTFGSEAVTTTAIYYRTMQSIEDVKSEAKFGEAVIDARNLLNMKTLQAALTDDLANGKIDIETWTKKDAAYSKAVETIQARLDADKFKTANARGLLAETHGNQVALNLKTVSASISKLSKMGDAYKVAADKSAERMANNYF